MTSTDDNMTTSTQSIPMRSIKLPRQQLQKLARKALQFRGEPLVDRPAPDSALKVVCISDTHNLRPKIPPGDLLIHAGDLTENGTFDELQAQLDWLSSHWHEHKVIIPGSNDLLLDTDFLALRPRHQDPQGRTWQDLDFGSITYLREESITFYFTTQKRFVNVFGTPWTSQYRPFASPYPRAIGMLHERVPLSTEILVTGPPPRPDGMHPSAGYSVWRKGLARVKPRLMVYGQTQVARGAEIVVFDKAQRLHDAILERTRGWEALPFLGLAVAWSRLNGLLGRTKQATRMVNASVTDGVNKQVALDAFVVEL